MMKKIPCEIICDLFPSYIDGLTSDVANSYIEEHVAECDSCRQILELMKGTSIEEANPPDTREEEKKEIDFLKKTRKKNHKIILGSILAAAVIICTVFLARFYLVGNYIVGDAVSCVLQVEGTQMTVKGSTIDPQLGISKLEYEEEDGVVTISFKAVQKNLLHSNQFQDEYRAENPIVQVRLGNRIIWSHGESISPVTSAVYQSRHAYIGDMSKNSKTAQALNMTHYLGGFTNELQTGQEPYEWKMILQEKIPEKQQKKKEENMRLYGYVLLSAIDNLSIVSYEYQVGDHSYTLEVGLEEASAFAGQDIKQCGQDILQLQALIQKAGIDSNAFVGDYSQWVNKECISLEIRNMTNAEISEMSINYYMDGKLYGTQGCTSGNQEGIKHGENITFELRAEDFNQSSLEEDAQIDLQVGIKDSEGTTYEIENLIHLPGISGLKYNYILTGNATQGYIISQ